MNKQAGFSVLEMVITLALGMGLSVLVLNTSLDTQKTLNRDMEKVSLVQSLRGTLDVVSAHIRIAGENLPEFFPAIETTRSGGISELIVRRNLLGEVLTNCQTLPAGGSASTFINFGNSTSTSAGCIRSNNLALQQAWDLYRDEHPGTLKAYIYDTEDEVGEFFEITTAEDDGTTLKLNHTHGTWSHEYLAELSAVYLIEEWRYFLEDETLKIHETTTNSTWNVGFNIYDFDVFTRLNTGTTTTIFPGANPWSIITSLEVKLKGRSEYAGREIRRDLSTKLFPRNVLSH
jgi:hypothetical protein